MMQRVLAVIPARGGSKGVPRKNVRTVAGIPLVCHAVRAAREARGIARCIVSTDSEEIAAVARGCGGEVPFLRPESLAGDAAPTWPALLHALEEMERIDGAVFDAVMTLQPTCPFRRGRDLDAALAVFWGAQPEVDSLISCSPEVARHPLTLYFKGSGPHLRQVLERGEPNIRRQDFPPVYWRNGAIYITRRDLLVADHRVISDSPALYEMAAEFAVNVDTEADLELAERLWPSWQTTA